MSAPTRDHRGSAGGTAVLAAEGVTVEIGPARLLDAVDLDVRPGEVLVLAGPNGAGKSTLLAALAGDVVPDRGLVRLGGEDVRGAGAGDLARRRAVLLQEHVVAFPFLVQEVVAMGRAPWYRTATAADDERLVAAALHRTDVGHLAQRRYPTLSGGEQARTSLARVLAQDCPVLLLDEPTAALDIHHQEQVLDLARELAGAGGSVVVVLHDLTLAAAHADRIALLQGGRVRALGPPAAVLTGPVLSEVYRHPVEVLTHPRTGELIVLPVRPPQPTPAVREDR